MPGAPGSQQNANQQDSSHEIREGNGNDGQGEERKTRNLERSDLAPLLGRGWVRVSGDLGRMTSILRQGFCVASALHP